MRCLQFFPLACKSNLVYITWNLYFWTAKIYEIFILWTIEIYTFFPYCDFIQHCKVTDFTDVKQWHCINYLRRHFFLERNIWKPWIMWHLAPLWLAVISRTSDTSQKLSSHTSDLPGYPAFDPQLNFIYLVSKYLIIPKPLPLWL
jgi:hypothetical protein